MFLSINIKRFRKDRRITQEQMADKLCMSQPTYWRLENDEAACTKRLPELAKALGTTAETLQTYHLAKNENGEPIPATWVLEQLAQQNDLLTDKENTIQQQQHTIQFQERYIAYVYNTLQNSGFQFTPPSDEPPLLSA
ncbi:helix-turn-helix domain-containing protein [Spirosoma gilvum]